MGFLSVTGSIFQRFVFVGLMNYWITWKLLRINLWLTLMDTQHKCRDLSHQPNPSFCEAASCLTLGDSFNVMSHLPASEAVGTGLSLPGTTWCLFNQVHRHRKLLVPHWYQLFLSFCFSLVPHLVFLHCLGYSSPALLMKELVLSVAVSLTGPCQCPHRSVKDAGHSYLHASILPIGSCIALCDHFQPT